MNNSTMLWVPFNEVEISDKIREWWEENGATEEGENGQNSHLTNRNIIVPIEEVMASSDLVVPYRSKADSLMLFNNRYGYYFLIRTSQAGQTTNHVVTLGRIHKNRRNQFRHNMSKIIQRVRKSR